MRRKWHIKLYNTPKTRRLAGIWKICCCIHFLAWISHSCIVIHKLLILDGSLHYVQGAPYAAILQIFYCLTWWDTVEFHCLPCPNNEMYDDAVFADRFHCQLTRVGIRVLIGLSRHLHAHIAYCQNNCRFLPNFLFFAWFDTVEFYRLPCPNNKMYDDVAFEIDSDITWLCLKCSYWWGYLDSLILMLHMNNDPYIVTYNVRLNKNNGVFHMKY